MTSGPRSSGSPGGAPQRFGYREWPTPSSRDGSVPRNPPGDPSLPPTESSHLDNCPPSYEMSERGASGRSRASSAPSADQSRPFSRAGSRPPSPASSSLRARLPSPTSSLHFRPLPPTPIVIFDLRLRRISCGSAASAGPAAKTAGNPAAFGSVQLSAATSDVLQVRYAEFADAKWIF